MSDADPHDPASPEKAAPPDLHGLDPADLLARGMNSLKPSPKSGPWAPPTPEELGRLLPQYHIERLLGRGGMGAVYKGTQPELERPVAIKLLPVEVAADEEFVTRFKREARTLARLRHSRIITVHDFGHTSEGHLYFVMECIDGRDLRKVLCGPGLTAEQTLAVISQICDALHAAHQQGVIHRDIKPENILITRDGYVKLADFGLARPLKEDADLLTGSHVVMGTPAYMAPEQRSGNADHRSDIYPLGVMLYEMLTGKRPHGVFDPPSVKAKTDARLDHVVRKALQQEPERRYQEVKEMKTEVDAIFATMRGVKQPPHGFATPTPEKARPAGWRGWRSKRLSLAAAVVIPLLVIGGGLGLMKIQKRPLSPVEAATKEQPFVNSLGMRFVPVAITGGPTQRKKVLFSVWETRGRDYESFAAATARQWQKPYGTEGATHPAVNVSWEDAKAFCAWLTARERASGKIGAREEYRLPSDHEWSCAVGIGSLEDAAAEPGSKSANLELYPWGTQWPPPSEAGNYGSSLQVDHFEHTSPVESFGANKNGLYDVGGNVWQWCEDWYDAKQGGRVARGGSWKDADPIVLQAAFRGVNDPMTHHDDLGFRCVLAVFAGLQETRKPPPKVSLATPPISPKAAIPQIPPKAAPPYISPSASKERPFVNSLGMKFVPVAGTNVLFNVWDTRVQDYAEYARERGVTPLKPGFEQGSTHPVVMVSWEDAHAFCAWLSKKERRAYRLPTDAEWSTAVGLSAEQGATPREKSVKGPRDVYPWGTQWPPPQGAGNYGPSLKVDSFVYTSPVGTFSANRFGLYDMGGNVREWCEDLYTAKLEYRVLRGGSWYGVGPILLRSSFRYYVRPAGRIDIIGFRCVLVVSGS